MKYIIVLLFSANALMAQYVAVVFNSQSSGAPTNLWAECYYQATTNTRPPQVLFTVEDFNAYMATNMASFMSWQTNAVNPQFKLQQDLADFLAKMDKIETWIDKTQGSNSLTNAQRDNAINDLCQTFKKLRPVLKEIYKPQ